MTDAALLALLPQGFVVRPVTMDDVATAVDLFNTCALHMTGKAETSVENLRSEWEDPDFNMLSATRTVWIPSGQLVAYIEVWDANPVPVKVWVWGRVHPAFEGLGIGKALMTWAEARAHEAIVRVPADARVVMNASTILTYEPAHRLLQGQGMSLVRHFWQMVIDLNAPPEPPQWPPGIRVTTYAEVGDLTAVYRASNDAFRDHWGHVEAPEETGVRRWHNWIATDHEFDPALWFIALNGDEIAGLSLCRRCSYDDPDMGWINSLSVRRPWRRQGLGMALLRHSFARLYQRGQQRVGLGVDAGSLTDATRLYRNAGMSVARQYDTYEKELRPGRELARQ